jgi:glycerol-3-phosphate acyltransferase PlsY
MLVPALVAFFLGYAVGALPVAWILATRGPAPRTGVRSRPATSAVGALFASGLRTALAAGLLECAKGAVVALVASLYSTAGWFIAVAVAGCVVGDAFPAGLRRGGRGLLPLVTALLVALPTAGLITAVVALPVALLTSMRGRVFAVALTVAVPAGLVAGTRDWRSLAPAAVIVGAILLRRRLRQRGRAAVLAQPAWQSLVIDAEPAAGGRRRSARQNRATWEI